MQLSSHCQLCPCLGSFAHVHVRSRATSLVNQASGRQKASVKGSGRTLFLIMLCRSGVMLKGRTRMPTADLMSMHFVSTTQDTIGAWLIYFRWGVNLAIELVSDRSRADTRRSIRPHTGAIPSCYDLKTPRAWGPLAQDAVHIELHQSATRRAWLSRCSWNSCVSPS